MSAAFSNRVGQDAIVRAMVAADIPAGLRLCRAAGWNQTARDWEFFLTAAPRGALVVEEHGVVIGTVATLPYGPFAWVSMVLVDPGARNRGIGTMLLDRGLTLVPEGATARLDATPAGEVLYRKLGFTGEYRLARWFCEATPALEQRGTGARQLRTVDWPAVRALDIRAFGASRAVLLQRLADEAPEYAWVLDADGAVAGFLFGRHGHVREQLGPLVADGHESARALLEACLAANPGRAVFLDAPDDQHEWRHFLATAGFHIERPFLRMRRGGPPTADGPALVYAITGPEFG